MTITCCTILLTASLGDDLDRHQLGMSDFLRRNPQGGRRSQRGHDDGRGGDHDVDDAYDAENRVQTVGRFRWAISAIMERWEYRAVQAVGFFSSMKSSEKRMRWCCMGFEGNLQMVGERGLRYSRQCEKGPIQHSYYSTVRLVQVLQCLTANIR